MTGRQQISISDFAGHGHGKPISFHGAECEAASSMVNGTKPKHTTTLIILIALFATRYSVAIMLHYSSRPSRQMRTSPNELAGGLSRCAISEQHDLASSDAADNSAISRAQSCYILHRVHPSIHCEDEGILSVPTHMITVASSSILVCIHTHGRPTS